MLNRVLRVVVPVVIIISSLVTVTAGAAPSVAPASHSKTLAATSAPTSRLTSARPATVPAAPSALASTAPGGRSLSQTQAAPAASSFVTGQGTQLYADGQPYRFSGRSISQTQTAPAASPFVTRQGTQLYADGQPYRFIGLNIFNANSMNNCWYTMGTGSGLDSSLSAIPGQNVFRAWFFQQEATPNGVRDWSAFDHTLAVAKAHGERVMVTLADEWGSCEDGLYKNEGWYQSGYRTAIAPGSTEPYRDWVAAMVNRYRNDPTIMAWQLMNEAEDSTTVFQSACSGTADATLISWATDMASLVKGADTNHLLSLGTLGTGQCGTGDYGALHAVSDIDLCESHDYAEPMSPMPGDQWHGLQARINQCAALNKPLFMGETGISSVGTLQQRASLFQAKFSAQFSAGVVGELVWAWREASQGGSSATDYRVGPGDPILSLFASASPGLSSLGGWLVAP
jgi:mannan endo-1,4-beta-mannosidase